MMFKTARKDDCKQKKDDLAFVFSGNELLLSGDRVPAFSEVAEMSLEHGLFFGTLGSAGCFLYELPENSGKMNDHGYLRFVPLREFILEHEAEWSSAAGYASHLLHWHRHSRFCGRCGAGNTWHGSELAKICPDCGSTQFPKISPAIIIMVEKEGRILLAHNSNFPEGRYSLLAGFMEIGETIEETAKREVLEEAGIEIDNIRYISSQSWPFPDSLMIGLKADYRSGEITPDGIEIVHADWYSPEDFPNIPGSGTIARRIIDEYVKTST